MLKFDETAAAVPTSPFEGRWRRLSPISLVMDYKLINQQQPSTQEQKDYPERVYTRPFIKVSRSHFNAFASCVWVLIIMKFLHLSPVASLIIFALALPGMCGCVYVKGCHVSTFAVLTTRKTFVKYLPTFPNAKRKYGCEGV